MGMYVIDDQRQLWRVDRRQADDFEHLPVERPSTDGRNWETKRLKYDSVIVDPTDRELAELSDCELARFGLSRERLLD